MSSVLQNTLTREQWLQRYHEIKSNSNAQMSLRSWDKFLNHEYTNDVEQIILKQIRESQGQEKYLLLDRFVQYLVNQKLSPATVRNYFVFIRSYLRSQGIQTDQESIKDYVKFPKRIKEQKSSLTNDKIRKILEYSDQKYVAFWLCLLSSGMRLGELLYAQLSWFDFTKSPVIIRIPARQTKGKADRFTFITSEAYSFLKPLIENKKPDELVFDMQDVSVVESYMIWLRHRTGLEEKYGNGHNYKVHVHAFRSYFRTRVSDKLGLEFAYLLLGQEGYLSQYYRKTEEEAAELYRKVEPDLTISDEQRLKLKVAKQQKELEEKDSMKMELERMKFEIQRLKKATKVV